MGLSTSDTMLKLLTRDYVRCDIFDISTYDQ